MIDCSWCKKPIELEGGEEPIRIDVSGIGGDLSIRMHSACYSDSGFKDIFEPFPLSDPV
jgi:hypothetical protein